MVLKRVALLGFRALPGAENLKPRKSSPDAHASKGLWRNGSASDSRSEGWEFEFSALTFSIFYLKRLDSLQRARGVVVSHPLSMREALGSIPSVSIFDWILKATAAKCGAGR